MRASKLIRKFRVVKNNKVIALMTCMMFFFQFSIQLMSEILWGKLRGKLYK